MPPAPSGTVVNAMPNEELLSQTNADLNEAHTLVEIARRILWSAENDPSNPDEPSARIRQIVDQLDQTHGLIDALLDEIENELEIASVGPSKPERHPLVH
jgi:hypothetical protein